MKNRINLKIFSAILWSLLTIGLIGWWWVWALSFSEQMSPQYHRMIKYEGATLFTVVIIGSGFLIGYIWRDHQKNEKLKLFFSVFTHDIKTSISRLRLQTAVFEEELENNSHLIRFKKDMARLDLQLENSLLLTNKSHQKPLLEKIKMSQLISTIKEDFESLHIEMNQDFYLLTDRKWMLCILRNIFQNALSHGKATDIKISSENNKYHQIIKISDNGCGLNPQQYSEISLLGQQILKTNLNQSNGIGLYLTRLLLKRLKSTIEFQSNPQGFTVLITVPGGSI